MISKQRWTGPGHGIIQTAALVHLTNATSLEFNGHPSTCILTSYALHNVLQRTGFDSSLLRVEVGVFPDDRNLCAVILGGGRARQSVPEMWSGHLVVIVGKQWLLDATLDQANEVHNWPSACRVGPAVVEVTPQFFEDRPCPHQVLVQMGNTCVRYTRYHRQKGFAHAPDARPSHWMPLADIIMAKLFVG
jgi:hypothetical protein